MEHPIPFVCPDCGFRVFNRRYPKCEACGSLLPASVVYTAEQRKDLFAQEDVVVQAGSEATASGSSLKGVAAEAGLSAAVYLAVTVATGNS